MQTKIKIIAAAVKYKGATFTGVRHCEIFADLRKLGHDGPFFEDKGYFQGFLASNNRFYDRAISKEIVKKSGQEYNPCSSTLTSEDLW